MKLRLLLATAAVLSLAACSGEGITGLDQMIYNATYRGAATLQAGAAAGTPAGASQPLVISMTTSQLGQSFSGNFALSDSAGTQVYAGNIVGKTTNMGADFTFVVPAPCAGTLYGSFTVTNGELTGSASGRDCNASASGSNVRIGFTNLVRQ